jgi:DNA-binding NarL/FixJ family response regulator
MDIRMPGLDGLGATRRIAADDSLAGVRVLILTTFEVDEYVFEALRSGASGFLGKGARPDALIEAIRTVARGDALLSPSATRGLIARFLARPDSEPVSHSPVLATLTDREREVVALAADGMSNAEIARQLTLSPLTVKTHANHAMTKLGARDRAQLVVLAYQTGLARAPRPGRELPRRREQARLAHWRALFGFSSTNDWKWFPPTSTVVNDNTWKRSASASLIRLSERNAKKRGTGWWSSRIGPSSSAPPQVPA